MVSDGYYSGDEKLRKVLDNALEESGADPMEVLAAVLGATREDQRNEELNLQGQIAGEWRLVRVLGMGGMGVTYVARNSLGEKAAVKVVGKVKAGSMGRFDAECKMLSHLSLEGVVNYLGRGRLETGQAYMVMEYVEGCDLGQLVNDLRDGQETPVTTAMREVTGGQTEAIREKFCEMVHDVAKALHGVHEEGLVHRDVKPGNIMVRPDLSVVLIDFGLSRDAFRDDALTRTEAIIGTLQYMAPEQARSSADADRRADIYSLGLVLAHCLGGFDLLDGARDRSYPWRVPEFVREASRQGVPDPVQAILYRAVQYKPKDRYRSAGELSDDLSRYAARKRVHASLPSFWQRMALHPRCRLAASVVVTAILTLLIASALLPKPYLLTIDTINDAGEIIFDGEVIGVAPFEDLEVEPGQHEIIYAPPWTRPVRRIINIDRHRTQVTLRTIGHRIISEEDFASKESFGLLNIESGSPEDQLLVDGRPVTDKNRWRKLAPGWHKVEAIGRIEDETGAVRELRETIEVLVEEGTISSAMLLPVVMRKVPGSYRYTMRDITQIQRPTIQLDLEDGLVFWANEFKDTMPESATHTHIRTCVAPIIPNRDLILNTHHEFPEPMESMIVVWRESRKGVKNRMDSEYRVNGGRWQKHFKSPASDIGFTITKETAPPGGILSFDIRTTLRAAQRPTSYSTVEMFLGYFDRDTQRWCEPAFAIVAEPLRDER